MKIKNIEILGFRDNTFFSVSKMDLPGIIHYPLIKLDMYYYMVDTKKYCWIVIWVVIFIEILWNSWSTKLPVLDFPW